MFQLSGFYILCKELLWGWSVVLKIGGLTSEPI